MLAIPPSVLGTEEDAFKYICSLSFNDTHAITKTCSNVSDRSNKSLILSILETLGSLLGIAMTLSQDHLELSIKVTKWTTLHLRLLTLPLLNAISQATYRPEVAHLLLQHSNSVLERVRVSKGDYRRTMENRNALYLLSLQLSLFIEYQEMNNALEAFIMTIYSLDDQELEDYSELVSVEFSHSILSARHKLSLDQNILKQLYIICPSIFDTENDQWIQNTLSDDTVGWNDDGLNKCPSILQAIFSSDLLIYKHVQRLLVLHETNPEIPILPYLKLDSFY